MKTRKKAKAITVFAVIAVIAAAACIFTYIKLIPMVSIKSLLPMQEGISAKLNTNKNASGYMLEYSSSLKFSNSKENRIILKDGSAQIENLNGGEIYYVRARSYRNFGGITLLSPWCKASSTVTDKRVDLLYIGAAPAYKTILINKTVQINTFLIPANSSCRDITYTSSDDKIAAVDENGLVKGISAGNAKITISVEGSEKSAAVAITVKKPFVAATGIEFTDKAGKSVECGKTIQLHANILPADATNRAIIWEVDDETKAKVDSKGVVTALRPTEYLEVTATTKDKKFTAKYILKITKASGYLTEEYLDSLGLSGIDKLMIVAHPDDETLWGGAHLMNARYFVVVLTNAYKDERKSEFKKVMNMSNDKYLIMSYPDIKNTWYDKRGNYQYSVDEWSTVSDAVNADIKLILNYKHWSVIATHNPNGEYGHYHHKQVSDRVTSLAKGMLSQDQTLYYFGNWYSKNTKNPDSQLDSTNLSKKQNMINVYLPSSPYAINNNKHMIPYENWIKSTDWQLKKSR